MASNSKTKTTVRRVSKTAALIIATVLFACVAFFTTLVVLAHTSSLRASRAEYDHLREVADEVGMESGEFNGAHLSPLDIEMLQINSDYVAWLRIDGTAIDYPVVRGLDNTKYIDISFHGEKNVAGAIFMDYRNVGEDLPHIIIYGHNLQRGGMFSDLRKFLNRQYMEDNPIITLVVNGEEIDFVIFSARLTDISDPAYDLDLSNPRTFARFADKIDAPLQATQIITLSTCARRDGGGDARIVVQGYRVFN